MKISNQRFAALQKKLRERSEQLRSMQNRASKDAKAQVETSHSDEIDVASALESAESSRMMAEALRLELLQVESALNRMEAGSFGVCEECESDIPVKRLEIRPEARLCIDCQSEEERHYGGRANHGGDRGEIAFAS